MKRLTTTLTTKSRLLLCVLLLLAAFFRFYNLNWDEGHFFHPDERNIANAVSQLQLFTQLDPRFYAYGGFLIYLYKATTDLLSVMFANPLFQTDWAYINLVGRYYSAFFSTLTLIPLFLLGKKIASDRVAYLTCLLYVFTVSSIQTAHFSITENFLTLSLLTMTYLSLLLYENPSKKLILGIGLLLGISVATKTTGLSFALIPSITFLLLFLKKKLSFLSSFLALSSIGFLAFFVFTLFSPFTFLNWEKFMESMRFENSVVLGTNPVVYTLQFTNTAAYLFQIKNLFWQIGPVFLFSLLGIGFFFYQLIKRREPKLLLFIAFPIAYFLYVGSWHTKFIRYMVPLIPFFLFLASYVLFSLRKKWPIVGTTLIALSLLTSILWTLAFFSIYTREQTRIEASRWIYSNIEPGSRIYGEHWDEGLPIPLTSGSPLMYQVDQLTIYEPDTPEKIRYYAETLSHADYVTITTRRLYGTLLQLPDRYPITKRYYELLFSGELGYEKVAEFPSYPTLFGITINDRASEETFQVYDHPTPMIFKNTGNYSSEKIAEILSSS